MLRYTPNYNEFDIISNNILIAINIKSSDFSNSDCKDSHFFVMSNYFLRKNRNSIVLRWRRDYLPFGRCSPFSRVEPFDSHPAIILYFKEILRWRRDYLPFGRCSRFARVEPFDSHPAIILYFKEILRWRRDSNPRYGCPYVSLANWWFQPLTHST